MTTFKRRTYHNMGEWVADLRAMITQRKEIGDLMRGETITPVFRERLMLAVTAANTVAYL